MSESATIESAEPKEIVITPPDRGKGGPTDESLLEMQASVEKRYGAKPESKQSGSTRSEQPDKGGIPELRRSRDELVEKVKTHEKTLADRESEVTAYKKQIEEFDGTRKEFETLKTRLQQVEQERDGLKKLESVAALEQSPDFQRKFVQEPQRLGETLKGLAGMAGISPDELLDAVGKNGKAHYDAMDSLLSGAGLYARDEIVQTVKALKALDAERAEQLANAGEIVQKRSAEREAKERQRNEERTKVRETAWNESAVPLAKKLGLSEEKITEAAEIFRHNKDAGKAGEIVVKSLAYDSAINRVKELESQLASYEKATPGVKAGLTGRTEKVDPRQARKELVADAAEQLGWRR